MITTDLDPKASAKQKLLQKLQEETHRKIVPRALMTLAPFQQYYALSSTQKRLFLLQEMDLEATSYNLPVAFRIEGPLSSTLLQAAFEKIIARHDILRTGFRIEGDKIVQFVNEHALFQIEFGSLLEDLSQLFLKFVRPFDLTIPPLLRVMLTKISDNEHIAMLDMHHIISDGRSMAILLRELASFYEGTELPLLDRQYKDYVHWQQTDLLCPLLQMQKDYWLNQLSGELSQLNLTTDYKRQNLLLSDGNQLFFTLGTSLTHDLKRVASQQNTTLYMLLMAIYQVFLFKYTGQEEVIVGSSVEGRVLPEVKNLIGAFVNTIAIRGYPQSRKTFLEFLREVRATCLGAINNQDYPFAELVEALPLERNIGHSPVFDTFFDLHDDRHLTHHFGQLHITPLQFSHQAAKFDLSLEAINRGDHLEFYFEYSPSLFNYKTIEKMADHFLQITKEIIHFPEIELGNIQMLTEAERHLLITEINLLPNPINTDFRSYYEIFQEQVRIRPNAIAAVCEGEHLSYEDLDYRSSHLANHLINIGLGEDQIVAFLLDRGIYFLISLIAVFKTGGAYVPIDPDFPRERITSLIEESKCLFILGLEADDSHSCPLYLIPELLSTPVKDYGSFDIHPNNMAYVIFTSGSTGKPKGAMVEHAGMMNHLWIKVKDLGFSSSDIIAQTSSQTFDVSIWQFLIAPMVGGKVVILPNEKAWDPHLLLSRLQEEHVTVFETVPSHMHLILEAIELTSELTPILSLKWMLLNGEPLPTTLWHSWQRFFPSIPLLNAYGPTECSDDVTHYKLAKDFPIGQDVVPIGKVLDNLNIYILDRALAPVAFGLPGDLYVEGIGVSRGYLNDPVKTALAFLPLPFHIPNQEGKRMYRTGDLARYSVDGNIECLGRADLQIKIRGQRIELGEIEAILSHHSKVLQVVVEARSLNTKDKQLIAYVTLKQPHQLDLSSTDIVADLRCYAEAKLPHYMVPVFFIVLPAFPLLTNGKINRKALPDPELNHLTHREIISPRTEVEAKLLKIWHDLLKVSPICINDDFFQVGGHSLLATQMMARILQVTGVKLQMKLFFENPTISSLAKHLEHIPNRNEEIAEQLPVIRPDLVNRYLEFPLTDIQQAYWLGRSGLFDLGEVSVHVYSEYDCQNIDLFRLEQAWNHVIDRHEALRLVFTPEGRQRILKDRPYYSIDTQDLSGDSDAIVDQKLHKMREQYSHEVFEATQWPLFSIRAIKLKEVTRLYLSFDAMIVDGWSVEIIFKDWVNFYDNLKHAPSLLELSFRDYVLAMHSLPGLQRYQNDKKYWLDRLALFPSAPLLPTIKTSREIEHQKFSRSSFRFPCAKWEELQKMLLYKKLTQTGFLAALFSEVLHFYSNQNHFAINLTLFDRLPLHPQVNEIAGDFTSLTLLEIDRRFSESTFMLRAQKTQAQLWQDLDHSLFNGIEFLRAIALDRSQVDSNSLFPIVFTSVLGLDNKQNEDVLRIFGKEVFAITQTPQVWLDFKAYEVNGDLIIEWDFVVELFPSGFIEQMHASFCQLLQKLASETELWDKSNLLTLPVEQLKGRHVYNDTESPIQTDLLHNLFNTRVSSQPHHLAIVTPNENVTYDELYRRSNQIGHYLRAQGASSNQLVAIITEKRWEQVAGVLGILQAGSAYLPLDPSTPPARLEELLKMGNVKFILTTKSLISTLKNLEYFKDLSFDSFIALDDPSAPFLSYPESPLQAMQSLEDLAYVIFTSGSTGTPKGVMIDHGSAANTILDINQRYGVNKDDRLLALSNLNFDLSVYDIFGILAAGGTIVLPTENRVKDPAHWVELLLSESITLWNSVPMFMEMLIEFCHSEQLNSSLRLALLSGDWIPTELPSKIGKVFSERVKIISLGGATEASIWSIYYELSCNEIFLRSIPYGYPLANQQFYVLDAFIQMSPDWVKGDLYIGGAGLSKGYLQDPVKTQLTFLDHPVFGRLYKTGDLGRHVPNRGIEFLGRSDLQIKMNGYRVEIQEIESHLMQHPDIVHAVVSVQNESRHKMQLVAHIVPRLDSVPEGFSPAISDPSEVMAFKLQHKNKRSQKPEERSIPLKRHENVGDLAHTYFLRKSYRQFTGPSLPSADIHKWIMRSLQNSNKCISPQKFSLDSLSIVLESFSPLSLTDYPGLKYRYPSAGSLYPVQIYLEIGCGVLESIEGGYYYYDPFEHSLIKIRSLDNSYAHLSLFFVTKMHAITPIYGSLAEDFCALEVGYMMELLQTECENQRITIRDFSPQEGLNNLFDLERDQLILKGVELNSSIFSQTGSSTDLYLFIKQDGWYSYGCGGFEPLLEKVPLQLSLTSKESYSIYQDASFAIFFVESDHMRGPDHHNALIYTGKTAQKMMQNGSLFGIGTCPIGTIDDLALESLQRVAAGKKFIHGLFGGSISKSQMNSKTISKERTHKYEDEIKKYLYNRLPKYMVPSAFMIMQSLPLSVNGKIDRSNLPVIQIASEKRERTSPSNEIEERLLNLWAEILDIPQEAISVEDTFFELGGNSLLLIQLHNRIASSFSTSISIDKLFQYPKIQQLAKFLSDEQSSCLDAAAITEKAQQQRLSHLAKRRKSLGHE